MLVRSLRRSPLMSLLLLAAAAWPAAVPNIGQSEQQLLFLLNQARQQQGLPLLELDPRLTQAARKHSLQMSQRSMLGHEFAGEPDLRERLAAVAVPFDAVAENVAQASSAADAHTELMHSPGHRANILNPNYNAIGIAVAAGRNQELYFTEDFVHRVTQLAPAQLERALLDNMNAARAKHLLPPLAEINISMLNHEACRNQVNASSLSKAFSSAGWVVVFTASEPSQLPNDIIKVASNPQAKGVAIGACYPQGESYSVFQAVNIFFRSSTQ